MCIRDRSGIVVIVFDHHQHIARTDLFLGEQYVPADRLVKTVGPFIRPRADDRLFHAVPVVRALDRLKDIPAVEMCIRDSL